MYLWISITVQTLGELGPHFTQVERNSSLVIDPTWRREASAILGRLSNAGGELRGYMPIPAGLEGLDALMVEVGSDLEYIASEAEAGIDTLNMSRLNNATARMDRLVANMRSATSEIERVSGEFQPN